MWICQQSNDISNLASLLTGKMVFNINDPRTKTPELSNMTNNPVAAELIFIPAPRVGHIMSIIEIAKLLVNRDRRLAITVFVIKPLAVDSGPAITSYIESLTTNTMDRISFVQLPQHESPPGYDPEDHPLTSLAEFIKSHAKYVTHAVAEMTTQPRSRRVAGFVVDVFCTSMVDVAEEFNVPAYIYFTSSAAFLGFTQCIKTLCDDQKTDVIDVIELSNSDTEVSIQSFVKRVPTKVFWSPVKNRKGLDFVLWFASKLRSVRAIMVNTFSELETHAVESLSADVSIPPVYPVGPVLNLEDGSHAGTPFDNDVFMWLDGQPESSVVFLCFGSMGSFDEVQVKEIARGLERSGHRFVWSLRRPPLDQTTRTPSDYEDPRTALPEGFIERTSGIGKVIGWAPQVAILAHRAVGGFVSHCGWNSILESIWFGVPIATWPIYAEQQMNAFEVVMELGLAVEIKMDYIKDLSNLKANTTLVTGEEIESGIRRVIEDDDIRKKVKEMSRKSRLAMVEGGSSYESLGCLIQDFLTENS